MVLIVVTYLNIVMVFQLPVLLTYLHPLLLSAVILLVFVTYLQIALGLQISVLLIQQHQTEHYLTVTPYVQQYVVTVTLVLLLDKFVQLTHPHQTHSAVKHATMLIVYVLQDTNVVMAPA